MSGPTRFSTFVTAAVVATILVSSAAQAQTRYVDDNAPLGGDGLSWNTAHSFLQDALANVAGATEIRVGQGTYKPDQDEAGNVTPSDRTATFQLINGVALMGGYRGAFDGTGLPPDDRDVALFETILSGDLADDDLPNLAAGLACFSGDGEPFEPGCKTFDLDGDGDVDSTDLGNNENSYHVVRGSGTDDTAVLEGFTISGGNANGVVDTQQRGGGMFIASGNPGVSKCTFADNTAAIGGGMHKGDILSAATVTDCTFNGNTADSGGALFYVLSWNLLGQGATLVNCVFNGNPPGPQGSFNVRINTPCPDTDGDGVVNVLDLIELLVCFGQPAVPNCQLEDVNDDGQVNVLDLVELLLAFGTTCP